LRGPYERAAGSGVRATSSPEVVEQALRAFSLVGAGTPWKQAGFPMGPQKSALAVRAYYERVAAGMSERVPGARAAETWFTQHTLAGAAIVAARTAMQAAGEPASLWNMLVSVTQQERTGDV
jgi:hypothetical protein